MVTSMSQHTLKTVSGSASSSGQFVLWCLLLIAMIALILYHYSQLAGSFAVVVGGESLVFGVVSANGLVAGVIVVLEVFIGWLVVASRGMTAIRSPAIARIILNRAVKLACMSLLFIFATIETSLVLAVVSLEQGDALLADVLAGQDVTTTRDDLMVQVLVAAKMVVAFIFPFIQILAPLSASRVVRMLRR